MMSHRDETENDPQSDTSPPEAVDAESYVPASGEEIADIVPAEKWVSRPVSDEYEDRPDIHTVPDSETTVNKLERPEARDEAAPSDPQETEPREVDPSQTPSGADSASGAGEWEWYLKDGTVPYRVRPDGTTMHMFAMDHDGWAIGAAPLDDLWDSTAEEIAGIIGGHRRLTEPVSATTPTASTYREFPFAERRPLAEADATGDFPASEHDPLRAPGGMTEKQIRDAGLRVDVPFEAPMPKDITYKHTGQQEWKPPPGWREAVRKAAKRARGDTGED